MIVKESPRPKAQAGMISIYFSIRKQAYKTLLILHGGHQCN